MKILNTSPSTIFLSSLLLSISQNAPLALAHGSHDGNLALRHQLYQRNINGRYFSSHNEIRTSNPTSGVGASDGSQTLHARHLVKNSKRSRQKRSDSVKIAEEFIRKEVGEGTTWEIDSSYTDKDDGVEMAHVFAVQTWKGTRIDNARFNVNILRDGTILSFGSSFVPISSLRSRGLEPRQKMINPLDSLKGAVQTLKLGNTKSLDRATVGRTDSKERYTLTGSKSRKKNKYYKKPDVIIDGVEEVHSKPEASLTYMRNQDGTIESTWKLEYHSGATRLLIYADAYEKNKIHSVTDYTAHATYQVYNFNIGDPSQGERTFEVDPFKKDTSPLGWHSLKSQNFTSLRGNNVITIINPGAEIKDFPELQPPDGGDNRNFSYPFPINSTLANFMDWANAASAQAFYTCNMVHDLYEQLGFSSPAGNFEEELIGETGGEVGDAVVVHVLLGAPFYQSNAFMFTPPDGERPYMGLFIWPNPNSPIPVGFRDCAFDRDIVVHEYTHGLTSRLTGGPEDATCLRGFMESHGMDEGWADFYSMAVKMEPSHTRDTDYKVATWLTSPDADPDHPGLREYPYSTNLTRNPLLYSSIDASNIWRAPHRIGTVWCTMLVEVLWNLADKHGIQPSKFPEFDPKTKIPTNGRHLAMKLVLEGLKLQPCRPSFEAARDAIIDADIALTGGDNFCEIWTAFAKRGLGVDASNQSPDIETPKHIDGFAVPDECLCKTTDKQNVGS